MRNLVGVGERRLRLALPGPATHLAIDSEQQLVYVGGEGPVVQAHSLADGTVRRARAHVGAAVPLPPPPD